MAEKIFSSSQLPIRRTVELLPEVFKTGANAKFMAGVVDPLVQPGVLEKTVGYIGRKYGKTFKANDIYLDNDQTLRSRYQLEPGVVIRENDRAVDFCDYIDFKNQLNFFGNSNDRDDLVTDQDHYSWNPPIEWDKYSNYREYFWVPNGPPTVSVLGQGLGVTSTYRVRLGDGETWTLFPDGLTSNPTLTLYRGQTYVFNVNAPRNSFYIRSSFNQGSSSDYNKGVENAGTQNGKVVFTVPFDAPEVLYYQSNEEPTRYGKFLIDDIESNSKLDINKDILGKASYKSSNNIEFTNGLVVEFIGQTTPEKYAEGRWVVEGVGKEIRLINFDDLVVPTINQDNPEVLFDNTGFDTEPFDDASSYPSAKDYITINRSSLDNNPWSRYNRWFHRSVLEYSHSLNDTSVDLPESSRAKRPIIEFKADLQMFNHGAKAKQSIDYIDTYTNDAFSKIEGSPGYSIDNEFLFEGARILITNDTDSWVNNKIYNVSFITHNGKKQISLLEAADAEPIIGDTVLVRRGKKEAGQMYFYNGTSWIKSQEKTKVNQPPLFDAFNKDGVSFSDQSTYPVSTFNGTKIISYKPGNGRIDSELGFSLSYLNIDNVGDIEFTFDWDKQTFSWQNNQDVVTEDIKLGFFKVNNLYGDEIYENGWIKTKTEYLQPVIDSTTISESTDTIVSKACVWKETENEKIIFYINGNLYTGTYERIDLDTFVFPTAFNENDVVTIKVYSDLVPDIGYYEIPKGLERNPLNVDLESFTLGQAVDHVSTMVELADDFSGSFPGVSNLRDLSDYQNLGQRFLKHSGSSALAINLLCNKDTNLIRSIQYSKSSYTRFKNSFLSLASELFYDQGPVEFVDQILSEISKTKNSNSPFSDTDMAGSGAFNKIEYEVEDEGITTFALTEKFDLQSLSRKAVYVYINNNQLIVNKDYEFNIDFGFLTINVPLTVGDIIEIREYVSTAYSYIPATPTALGLYKKYTPMIYVDDTYREPTKVIQGHDGSLTVAYNDIRDEVLLELEKRIYNNIKKEYNPDLFDIDKILAGYYGDGIYNKDQFDDIIAGEFLKWIDNTDADYVSNEYFDSEDSFTYTYSRMSDPTKEKSLPGFWRGVYMWFYDTDRPHRRPWEMLGFSEEPDWWQQEYGPAPYTSGNLILWEDLENGIIKHGPRAGEYTRYKRPGLLTHIPVDGDGILLSPLDSNLARDFNLINNQGDFVIGDIAPAESAWRRSSELPFAVMVAMTLMRPFEFVSKFLNVDQIQLNKIGQYIDKFSGTFQKHSDIIVPVAGHAQTSGLVNWITDYLKSKDQTSAVLQNQIDNIDVNISNRIGGFVDQAQQRYLLDSKSPQSTSSSVFIPQENYDIIFDVSSPIGSISYSGVIFEKTNKGWRVTGYDDLVPYFNYFEAQPTQRDPVVSVGGVSENFVDWTDNKYYSNGQIVRYSGFYYRTLQSHTSGEEFDSALFRQIPGLPSVGAVEAQKRSKFNFLKVKRLGYGTVLTTIQQVVDFLLGYEQYLKSIGMVFDRYDSENQITQNWFTSAKEFMFWTKHNWAEGSLLTVSPAADQIKIAAPIGVADSLFDSFYEYRVLRSDGTPLLPQFINVNRDIQELTIEKTDTTDGIYYVKINFVLKEHVVLFSDRTVFNDVIYDKAAGYRQDRIKVRGFRTTDWGGDYNSPGFIFDNVSIQDWKPYTDYKLGDIVGYREFYWTSKVNQEGTENFDDTNWSRLDLIPTKGLIPNFDYKINQFDDYYDLDADGVGSSQRDLSRHGIGYQQREYLENIAEDQVSQFKIYQGFIREKGTQNSITKVFDKLSRSGGDSVTVNEEWAFKLGTFGGSDQQLEYEFQLDKPSLEINPQPIIFVESLAGLSDLDRYVYLTKPDFKILPDNNNYNTNVNPTTKYDLPGRSAGYVKTDQTEFTIKNRDDILNLNILSFKDGDHVWVTFENADWTVLRYVVTDQKVNLVSDPAFTVSEQDDTKVTFTLQNVTDIVAGDIIGIRGVTSLTGFFKVTDVTNKQITIDVRASIKQNAIAIETSSVVVLGVFENARFNTYSDVTPGDVALLNDGSKLWIDKNSDGRWEVVEKSSQFEFLEVDDFGLPDIFRAGEVVKYVDAIKQLIVGVPSSETVAIYNAARPTLLAQQFLVSPKNILPQNIANTFGQTVSVSPDHRWLVVGSPNASGVESYYKGFFDTNANYNENDIVFAQGNLWYAKRPVAGDGSTIDIDSEDWAPARSISATIGAGGDTSLTQQGVITIYEWGTASEIAPDWNAEQLYTKNDIVNYNGIQYIALVSNIDAGTLPTDAVSWASVPGRWNEKITLLSPRPESFEYFGKSINISANDDGTYTMAVSAPGSLSSTGRVYIFEFDGTSWKTANNSSYVGVFDSTPGNSYVAGSVVWYNGDLWQANEDITTDGSTSVTSDLWTRIDPISTRSSLPQVSAFDTGGYDYNDIGFLSQEKLAALVEAGDNYGFSMAMSGNGNVLAIGAPTASEEYFENYKGTWKNYNYYETNSVVRDFGSYYKLNPLLDSTGTELESFTKTVLFRDQIQDWTARTTEETFYIAGERVLYNLKFWERNEDQTGSEVAFVEADWTEIDALDITNISTVEVNEVSVFDLPTEYVTIMSTLFLGSPYMYMTVKGASTEATFLLTSIMPEPDWHRFTAKFVNGTMPELGETVTISFNIFEPAGDIQQGEEESPKTLGKVFIYEKSQYGNYELLQTISATVAQDSLPEGSIKIGDKFGTSMAIDQTGNSLVVGSPFADNKSQNQGAVFVFSKNVSEGKFKFLQKLESFKTVNNENFGNSVSISPNADLIAVGAQNSVNVLEATFDNSETSFDNSSTSFVSSQGATGQVYIFENKSGIYLLTEKLKTNLASNESFGYSIDASSNIIAVGSPTYKDPVTDIIVGRVRLFSNDSSEDSLKVISSQPDLVNIDLLTGLSVYDTVNSVKLDDIDIVDHFKLKIVGTAEQEISFKTPYDPAVYMLGTDEQIVDADQAWFEENVGEVWWDISKAKWIWYEQGDTAYRTGNWNQLAEGASIDVYEWVESKLKPSEWFALSGTAQGIADGITGVPLHPDDSVYNTKKQYNSTTQAVSGTKYYYWVKDKTTLPLNNPKRNSTVADVVSLISNPVGSGTPLIALIDSDKMLAYNFEGLIPGNTASVNIRFKKNLKSINEVHNEYKLLSEGNVNSIIPETLETKWLDSLVGYDKAGNIVPDPLLSDKQKYGTSFRPRQTMFIDKNKALRIAVERINDILLTRPFAENINLANFNSIDPVPEQELNLYDQEVDQRIDIEVIGTARLRPAILRANIIDGEIDTIDIVDSGFGYRVPPPIDIQGDGKGAKAEATIDNQGRINSVRVLSRGKKYSSVIIRVRSFSVLVKNDDTANNFWTIYSWDQKSKTFFRSNTQKYNTSNYWSYIDWWADGYDSNSREVAEIKELYLENTVSIEVGDLLRVREYANGGWAVLKRSDTNSEILGKYQIVGRQNGTIRLSDNLWNYAINSIGYDNLGSYDSIPFDQQPITELRNIFLGVKEDVFTGDLEVEWNKLFFACVNYAFSEQLYVDWAFKTSFISAIHQVGDLDQKVNYKNDNLASFNEYLQEVKPYRTKIREYTSRYTETQIANTPTTDFDNVPYYSESDNRVMSVKTTSEQVNEYPWKWWFDNRGYSVVEIKISDPGRNYTSVPKVVISSDTGSGAKAKAFISNGKVSGIQITSQGSGYLTAPGVSIIGGNGADGIAKAVAILGDGKVRNFNMSMKFDRITKEGIYSSLTHEETLIAPGATGVFNLSYAPTTDKSKIVVTKNGELIINSEYQIDLFYSNSDKYSLIRGKLRFNTAPAAGDVIKVEYEKNDLLLDATSRIEKFYNPTTGMIGFATESFTMPITKAANNTQQLEILDNRDIKVGMRITGPGVVPSRITAVTSDSHVIVSKVQNLPTGTVLTISYNNPNQLMTGIDFGGVQIQGNLFDVTGGWDALPWFTDTWDSVKSSPDYFYVIDSDAWDNTFTYKPGAIVYYNNLLYRATDLNLNQTPSETSLFWEPCDYVQLPTAPAQDELISVYLKKDNSDKSVRIDDPNYGTSEQTNENALIPSFIGNGSNRIVNIPRIATTTINDENLYMHNTTVYSNNRVEDFHFQSSIQALDVDYVTFTVGSTPITALYLTEYAGVDGIAFFAIQEGNAWTVGQDTTQMLAYGHFGPDVPNYGVGDNLLSPQSARLNPNTTYTMWIQQTGNNITDYTISTDPAYTADIATDGSTQYSDNPDSPTEVTSVPFANPGDVDYVKFTVGTQPITELYLNKYVGADGIAFFAIQEGDQFTAGQDVSQMVVYSHFGPGEPNYGVGDNLLADQNITLNANTTYTMWIQQTGSTLTEYAISTDAAYTGEASLPSNYSQDPLNPTQLDLVVNSTTTYEDRIEPGDTLTFRTSDSDGTVSISDTNLLDTDLSGGTLDTVKGAYSTANGLAAEDIVVDGEQFISPDQVPATEENIPGQVLDSVSIKVFHSKPTGAPVVKAKVIPAIAGQQTYEVGQTILEPDNVIVYVDKIKKEYDVEYTIDFNANTVRFDIDHIPAEGKLIEIVSIGLGGISILDYQEFIGDGETRLFLANADFNLTQSVLATVNGQFLQTGFSNSRGQVNDVDKTLVEIPQAPARGEVVKILTLGTVLDVPAGERNEPVVRVNQQTIRVDGSTRAYDLDNFVDLNLSSTRGSVIVDLNGHQLRPSDTVFLVYDGTNNTVILGTDPEKPAGTLAIDDISVYVNDIEFDYITGWTFRGANNELVILESRLNIGDRIRIEQNIDTDYNIVNNQIVLRSDLSINEGDVLEVTWFNNYPTVELVKELFTGGQVQYRLSRKPVDVDYVWVYKNGERLAGDVDYILSVEKNAIQLRVDSLTTDEINIIQFGNNVYRESTSYEVFKDMLNINRFNRFSINTVELTKQLNYYDKEIEVNDASDLALPNVKESLPGTVFVNGERIEYFVKEGNVLSQLRRGSMGTAIPEVHEVGSKVIDVGWNEQIPYTENQEKENFISDGTGLEIGPLEFTPIKSTREFFRETAQVTDNTGAVSTIYPSIPLTHGACDQIEVFVGGRRLNKSSSTVYEEDIAASSPDADVTKEAEFSVDGITPYIRLTQPVPAGIRITVLRRVGKTWYDLGDNSATTGVTMLDNESKIINFIAQRATKLP